ncbi:GH3 domain-containing protein-like isoform X1 [Saccostrea echinata]|uniref:GH3 domain-containing protein-like isoform X1 n=1 Tax=Saccostrea echinata TaxID=191078 RepID=UPI002A80FE4B|nr:GH3 domain-containing protein-like isoform X1 [Saccostrea echinata]
MINLRDWKVWCGTLLSLFVTYLLHHIVFDVPRHSPFTKLWAGLLTPVCGVSAIVCFDLARRKSSTFHTTRSKFDHYVAIAGLSWMGWFARRKMDKSCKDIVGTQNNLLQSHLKENAETQYGRKYGFSDIHSREDYVKQLPLTYISHYDPYIQQMMKGEEKILTTRPPVIFAVTSGTSGKSSILPMTGKQRLLFFIQGISVAYHSLLREFPENNNLQKTLKFFYTPQWRKSECGILIGPNSSSPTNSKHLLNIYSTPKAGFEILSEPEALYIHLLFGLRDKSLGMLEANFSSIILSSFDALYQNWSELADDIERGEVNPKLDIEESIRNELNSCLTPDPQRAKEIREIMKTKSKVGIGKLLWPDCNLVLAADSGSFDLPAKILRETYCKGIPIYSPLYAASEGLLGLNIWPKKHPSQYVLAAQSIFFEFIPVELSNEDQPKTFFMDEVEKGKEYELVITNASGLCRYRFGDIVKMVDFYYQCPVIEFKHRKGQFLNVRGEKTSESLFYQALTEAESAWFPQKLLNYCCVESLLIDDKGSSYAPFYHLFLELEDDSKLLTQKQREVVDKELCSRSYVYKSFRDKGSIQPVRVHQVKSGTFEELRKFTINNTQASANQYKVPRVLKTKETVNVLLQNVFDNK